MHAHLYRSCSCICIGYHACNQPPGSVAATAGLHLVQALEAATCTMGRRLMPAAPRWLFQSPCKRGWLRALQALQAAAAGNTHTPQRASTLQAPVICVQQLQNFLPTLKQARCSLGRIAGMNVLPATAGPGAFLMYCHLASVHGLM